MPAHRITVICDGQAVDGWTSYSVSTSMIEPADGFTLTRPFSNDAWILLRRDARVRILIDGTAVVTGFIDRRKKSARANTMEITGRCTVGRLVQESAPSISYERLSMLEAVKRLAYPFLTTVVTSDANNRNLRRGKGRRVPAGNEPLVINLPVPKRGRVHPGMARWAVIEEIISQPGYIAWSSGDGTTLFVGKPNYSQAAQFLFCNARPGSPNRTTTKMMDLIEDNGDRYSMIAVVGTGGGDDANYGANITDRSGRALDFPTPEGTGRDFLYPKRLLMPERDFDTNQDAQRVADRDQARRDFRRTTLSVVQPDHGQMIGVVSPTIYTPNTIARCIDEDFDPAMDDTFLIYSCTYEGSHDAQTTSIELVPTGTEIIL
jgi:prophage tail gpP-like protein